MFIETKKNTSNFDTHITRKNPIAIKITPASFMPAKVAPYKTISSATKRITKDFLFSTRIQSTNAEKIFTRRNWNTCN